MRLYTSGHKLIVVPITLIVFYWAVLTGVLGFRLDSRLLPHIDGGRYLQINEYVMYLIKLGKTTTQNNTNYTKLMPPRNNTYVEKSILIT